LFTAIVTALTASAGGVPVTLGVYAPYGVQPGLRLGTYKSFGEREGRWTTSWFTGPRIAVFTRPWNHTSALIDAELGYWIQRPDRRFYSAWSLGAGYLASSQVVSESVALSTGASTPERALRSYFAPSLSYELGWSLRPDRAVFCELSFGRKMSGQIEDSALFAVEVGARFGGAR